MTKPNHGLYLSLGTLQLTLLIDGYIEIPMFHGCTCTNECNECDTDLQPVNMLLRLLL